MAMGLTNAVINFIEKDFLGGEHEFLEKVDRF
jgi:hypothetical protein